MAPANQLVLDEHGHDHWPVLKASSVLDSLLHPQLFSIFIVVHNPIPPPFLLLLQLPAGPCHFQSFQSAATNHLPKPCPSPGIPANATPH